MLDALTFPFKNSFADEMEGFFVPWEGDKVPDPQIAVLNTALAQELGLDPEALNAPDGAAALSGAKAPLALRLWQWLMLAISSAAFPPSWAMAVLSCLVNLSISKASAVICTSRARAAPPFLAVATARPFWAPSCVNT